MIFSKYLILTPLFYSFGNASEELYLAHIKAAAAGKKLLVMRPYLFTQILSYSVCNNELFCLIFDNGISPCEKAMMAVLRLVINFNFLVHRSIALLFLRVFDIRLQQKYFFPRLGIDSLWPAKLPLHNLNINNFHSLLTADISVTDSLPTLNVSQLSRARAEFSRLNIPPFSKYVCLHVRDSGFHQDSQRRAYRNACIDNYIPSIKLLIRMGFYVIRIGDNSMLSCSYRGEGFIEYSHCSLKTELLDLYLVEH